MDRNLTFLQQSYERLGVPGMLLLQESQLVMRGPHVVGLDPAVTFSVQLQRLRDADQPAPVDCSECSANFSSLDDACV